MVRSATKRGARRPELRRALIEGARRLAESCPDSGGGALHGHAAGLKSGPIVLSTASMFHAVYHGVGPSAADPYVYRSDPDNVRRWLLDENDVLTELDREPCQKRVCNCPPEFTGGGVHEQRRLRQR